MNSGTEKSEQELTDLFKEVLQIEARALDEASKKLIPAQVSKVLKIFEHLVRSGGSLITTGIGKSGQIGAKISSTFSSVGLPSFFLHPTEALHGDLGRLSNSDAILFLSKSGSTEEILKLVPYLPMGKEKRIGLLGTMDSVLTRQCEVVFDCSVEKEACINDLAPTTSATLSMAMGHGLAVIFESFTGLSKERFAKNHPGGLLGKSLSLKVKDVMVLKENCAFVSVSQKLSDVIIKMTQIPLGICVVLDEEENYRGIIVEGDIRRTLADKNKGLDTPVRDMVNSNPVNIDEEKLAFEALSLMEAREKQISVLPVFKGKDLVGILRLHDLLREGFKQRENN